MRVCYLILLPMLALSLRASASERPDSGFGMAIDALMPRVVKLYGLGAGEQPGYGTGTLVSADGKVLTVLSLLIDARPVRAVAADGTEYHATVLHRDEQRQLALLQLEPARRVVHRIVEGRIEVVPVEEGEQEVPTPPDFPHFELTAEAVLEPGDWVVAAGNSFKVADGFEPMSIAHGMYSVRTPLDARRRVKDFPYTGDVLVLDAITSNPGAPGSAVVNLDGELVGMVGRVVYSNLTHTNLNHAVPRDVLAEFFRQAIDPAYRAQVAAQPSEATEAIDLGIKVAKVGYRTVLPFVERVRLGSPAFRAGVRKDDLVLSINGRNVPDVETFEARLAALPADRPVELVVRRGRGIKTIRIEPGEGK